MRKNRLREAWSRGEKTVNGWLSIPSSFSAEVMAQQGWDSLTIDTQHGLIDYQSATTMLQAISTTETVPIVRVPWREPGIIMKMLDAGAYGVLCPMVNSAGQAAELVSYCRYPPEGQRSFGPIRALLYAGADYPSHANDEILVIAMIETREALNNLDDIAATPGIDALYIGPADLSNSLGCTPKFDQEEQPVVDAIDAILEGARKAGKHAGIHCGSPDYASRMLENGFDFVTILSDARMIAAQSSAVLSQVRGSRQKEGGSGY